MIAEEWSEQLGLAITPLFGATAEPAAHTAMLDGVAGSFVLSTQDDRVARDARDLSWSSMMRHHVLVDDGAVRVSPSDGSHAARIDMRAVEGDLEGFLRYLEGNGQQGFDVIDHVISTFQALRMNLALPAEHHLEIFLALLAVRLDNPDTPSRELPSMVGAATQVAARFGLGEGAADMANGLPRDLLSRFYDHLATDRRTGRELFVDLTIRHAGAELFQAAHLAPPVEPRQNELWGLGGGSIRVRPHSLKEVAYTPVGLARSLAEQVISQARPREGEDLVVMDPACGSGSFLVEALAALQRKGWRTPVKLVGMDISGNALATARFAVACAKMQNLSFAVTEEFVRGDFLRDEPITAKPDLVLMNPPFRAWPDMDPEDRETTRSILGRSYRGRPDKSMGFLQRAVEVAGPDGVIGVILPVGVVSGEGSKPWRDALLERAAPTMIATFGDHSLFRFATVSVCALVLDKGLAAENPASGDTNEVQMVWSSERAGAASHALRTLRRGRRGVGPVEQSGGEGNIAAWNLYPAPSDTLTRKPSWLPAPGLLSPAERRALSRLDHVVRDLFHVRTGVRAGERGAFLLDQAAYSSLPEKERWAFRPAAEKQAIAEGRIDSSLWLFSAGEEIETEAELNEKLPDYLNRHLIPWKNALSSRARTKGRWWRHSEPRNSWKDRRDPRLVSRQWFRNDGFAVDPDGAYAVVQGYAWFPTSLLTRSLTADEIGVDLEQVLHWYAVMMSSDVFFRICREYSTSAAGGQIALQQKYLNNVPIPLLPKVVREKPHLLDEMTRWDSGFPELADRNLFAAICYGFDLAN